MSYFGTILLAHSDRLLVDLPEVRTAFGTGWERLRRRADGRQLLEVIPHPHQWPTVGAGPGPLAVATGAPALAVWISESACGQFAAAWPDGSVWSGHYPDCKGAFDHHEQSTLRLPPGVEPPPASLGELTAVLSAWAGAAEMPVSAGEIGRPFIERPFVDAVEILIDRLGFAVVPGGAVEVPRLFEHKEREWMEVWYRGWRAAAEVCGEWSWRMTGLGRSTEQFEPTEAETELIRFLDRVAESMYGGGLTRAELAAEATRLETTFLAS